MYFYILHFYILEQVCRGQRRTPPGHPPTCDQNDDPIRGKDRKREEEGNQRRTTEGESSKRERQTEDSEEEKEEEDPSDQNHYRTVGTTEHGT